VARLTASDSFVDSCTIAGACSTMVRGLFPGPVVQREQVSILRCLFGNPFRPSILHFSWRTATVLALAKGIYESLEFSSMPILADALEDAACDDCDILEHCRGLGPHVRGCCVVDLVLGKS
jgi:hypothetical protein